MGTGDGSLESPGSLRGFCLWARDAEVRLYVRPLGLVPAALVPAEPRLAGGRFAFTRAELVVRAGDRIARAVVRLPEIRDWAQACGPSLAGQLDAWLAALTRPRAPFAGLALARPLLMGVVNVTPDSFSDGGRFFDPERALAHGRALVAAGADLLDIGGESTRPGAEPVPPEEEIRRVVPVIRGLAGLGVPISIDTRRAVVMRAALDAGATILNDVTGLTGDPESLAVAVRSGAPVILMHMQGEPRTMQQAPAYRDAALDVYDWLAARVAACRAAGIPETRLCVDPGIGFGKTPDHNLDILRQATLYHGLGVPVMIGVSRKSLIARLSRGEPPDRRLPGSLALGLASLDQGVQILRVHDVAETAQARCAWERLHTPA